MKLRLQCSALYVQLARQGKQSRHDRHAEQFEFHVALGEHFELPNGIQLVLGGQLEGPGGVQVALGGQFAKAKWCLMALKWRSEATLKGQAESK